MIFFTQSIITKDYFTTLGCQPLVIRGFHRYLGKTKTENIADGADGVVRRDLSRHYDSRLYRLDRRHQ
ncbi:MAG TPA: hypothetical protein VJ001_15250 [Rhodocyclaceae bacterium]|nr:hypothetical protein [Rhodocyclaceae bacterium]